MTLGKAFCPILALVLVFVTNATSSVAPLHLKSKEHRIPGHYIVVLKDDADVDTFTTAFEASVLRGASNGQIEHKYNYAIKGFSAQLSKDTVDKLRKSEHVKYIEENGIVHASAVSSWGLGRVDQRDLPLDSNSPDYIGRGSGTHIYVIDTGTLSTHNEFSGRFGAGYDAISNQIGVDCHGHGTHCGGTAAGTTYGVASQATVYSVRVLGCDGSGSNSGVIAGMNWVAQNAQSPGIASMSLGGGYSQSVNDAVQTMVNAGVVVSVAAGNDNQDACDSSPASAPAAITVGATDNSDTRAYWSNYGECVDIFAPGVSITSAWIGSNSATTTISGTSMACPHVSGAAAALRSVDSSLTPSQVTHQLLGASTPNKVSNPASPNRLLYIGKSTCMTRCGSAQDGSRPCQCDTGCASRGDCCSDYAALCTSNAPTCDGRCDSNDANYPCQCDSSCQSRGDCCSDYLVKCNAPPDVPGCDVTVSQEGYVTSPNYPSYYQNSLMYHTCITAPAGQKIILTFLHFDLEYEYFCDYDMLRIFDGSDASASLLGTFCGYDLTYPDYFQSSGESLFLVLETDGSVTHPGYQAEINFLAQAGSCDASVNSEGTISSPSYSGHYLNDQTCRTLITAGAGQTIRLTFDSSFDIEDSYGCIYDSLTIYDGTDDSSPVVDVLCGSWWDIPDYVESTGSSLYVVFETDESVVHAGYQAAVTFQQGVLKMSHEPTMRIPEKVIDQMKPEPTMRIPEKMRKQMKPEPTMGIPEILRKAGKTDGDP